MRYFFYISVGVVMLAIAGMLVFLYTDSAKQLSEASVSNSPDSPPPERSEAAEVIDAFNSEAYFWS